MPSFVLGVRVLLCWLITGGGFLFAVRYMRYTNGTYDGQAQAIVPGRLHSRYGGFLPTLQLLGIRDGIEGAALRNYDAHHHRKGFMEFLLHTRIARTCVRILTLSTCTDLELYKLLASRIKQASVLGLTDSEAVQATMVPDALIAGVSAEEDPATRIFSEDPVALRAQWRRVVKSIARLESAIAAVTEEITVGPRAGGLKSDDDTSVVGSDEAAQNEKGRYPDAGVLVYGGGVQVGFVNATNGSTPETETANLNMIRSTNELMLEFLPDRPLASKTDDATPTALDRVHPKQRRRLIGVIQATA